MSQSDMDIKIIMSSKFADVEYINTDDYEVFTEEFVEQKARENIESYAEEWWEDLRQNWRHDYIMNFVDFDIYKFIEGCINIDGYELHAGIDDCDVVEYEDKNYYVINRGDIPW